MNPGLRGYFINLDRAAGRRAHMEAELLHRGLAGTYTRFTAVDGQDSPQPDVKKNGLTAGEIALFRSHIDVLKQAATSGVYVHILEDDVVLSKRMEPVLNAFIKAGLLSVFDIVFLNFAFNPGPIELRTLISASRSAFAKPPQDLQPFDFQLVDVQQLYLYGADSYVVNPASCASVLDRYRTEWEAGPTCPLDVFFLREMQAGRLRGGAILPFLTSLSEEHARASQLGRRHAPTPVPEAIAIMQRLFYVDRDLSEIGTRIDRFAAQTSDKPRHDPAAELLLRTLGVLITK